ncbi:MAG TPA: RNA polymerase sporulation sigma factor SigK [Firmicutes bacterium]|nr:RNA polymerase sporulation sigma factor SigK [Candidatus Fermentithermobacillaceae bacterium]
MWGVLAELASGLLKMLEHAVGYFTANRFPHPLSEEEERKQIEACQKGDRNARNTLIEHNLRLVAHIVKKFDPPPQDVEDLISIGTIGLCKAINTYEMDKGTRLATYASKCIENEILMYLRASKPFKNKVYLFDPVNADGGDGEVSYIDVVKDEEPDVSEIVSDREEARDIVRRFAVLDDRQKLVLGLRYGLSGKRKTQKEIAKLLGISRSYVSRIEKRALAKLGKAFEN